MKKIEIDDELYQYIASNTQSIGESASQILRRLLNLSTDSKTSAIVTDDVAQDMDQSEASKQADTPVELHENVFNILNKEELAMQKGVVGRFLFILCALHRTHKKNFNKVLDIKGRDRIYFAKSKEALLESGSSMNPKNILDSEYWVMTNSNTTRKKMMLHEVALSLGYNEAQAETIRDYL
ncbi:Negative modulator of initiation of replication [Pseudoalteromonas holothuriae]|uniref:Negative modulator of initiation of replication n=1 Tax=Pseudoalteromonas holothuriae TaxID=2963714 RepID=A0A9W4R0E9_9GAMM|nr:MULTISPECIES: replication initiation negative regulator SeqA [unclassified Pseudoalteromonas]CAH9060661.1 Negative modulator of initiation of replication [Pseudoalteromonas sp. CIP111951]CAH9060835.1 Negative modulator of initiation of replication [Pseudoalteromonas sp. CIP111854]